MGMEADADTRIEKAAVVGAGVMGAQIAAHIANAGIPVVLLDIVPEGADDRSILARTALDRLRKADPAPFMGKAAMSRVQPGNLEDDLGSLADVDWIVEAVIENLEIKQGLYRKLNEVRRPGSIMSSNTSTLPLGKLMAGLPEALRRDFLITHFYNPPRYLRLLEVVAGSDTRPEALDLISDFGDRALGKTVIRCKDTPGFLANRIGCFWIQAALTLAFEQRIGVEAADLVLGRPFGIPKTGVFGLADLVGIDLLPHVAASLRASLPADDAFHVVDRDLPLIRRMIADGYTGRKGKGGFYRLRREGAGRVKEALDLESGAYRMAMKPRLDAVEASRKTGPRALFEDDHPAARYAAAVMGRTLAYAASLVPEIADEIPAVDAALRTGYNWKQGPFELLDRIGPAWFRGWLEDAGLAIPPLLEAAGSGTFYTTWGGRLCHLRPDGTHAPLIRPDGVILLEDVKRGEEPLVRNGSASLWDLGDGVACLEFTTKMNALDLEILDLIEKAIRTVERSHKALVIYNEGTNFSVGANIGLALFAANAAAYPLIDEMVARGQRTLRKLKYAPFPVVAAPSGMALGGGCEVCLNADAIQAHAETYIGLVEVGVGLVPAWTGCTELLGRWLSSQDRPRGPMPAVAKVFETIGMAAVAKSAFEARDLLLLREGDGITMNRDRLLADAKAKALDLAHDYVPPAKPELNLPGPTARVAMELALDVLRRKGTATAHDEVVAKELAGVLSGGETDIVDPLTEDQMLKLEREAFRRLIHHPGTLARMEHMLENGKALRN